jgi:predicted nucleotidyltransferase
MKIFVLGNINSGKSYVVSKLKTIFPDYQILAIDEYRLNYSNGTLNSELKTRNLFANDILKHNNAIIEFSGGSTITNLFIDELRLNSFIIIEVTVDVNVCLKRIKNKDFSKVPYPIFEESLENTIIRLDQEFKDDIIKTNFKDKFLHYFKISSKVELNLLPLKQYAEALKISNHLQNGYKAIISYGSLGRHKMNQNSDLDIFLYTNKTIDAVYKDLLLIYQNSKFLFLNNQIAIYYEDQLIELSVISNLEDIQLYYVKSEIKNIKKTILLGYDQYHEQIENIVKNYKENFVDEFKYTMHRLEYFNLSLERLIKKNDDYKYFFHTNIIIHEYIKLKFFMAGKREYSYLPLNSFNYISYDAFQKLVYCVGDDKIKHSENVNNLVKQILNKANVYLNTIK